MHTHFHWYVKNSLAIQLYFKQLSHLPEIPPDES